MIHDPPPVVSEMRDRLLAQGFEVVESRTGSMGMVEVVLVGPASNDDSYPKAWVRISGDRGHWSLGLKFGEMSKFMVPWVWAAYLDDAEVVPVDLDQHAGFMTSRLAEAAQAVLTDRGLEATLVQMGREYMTRYHQQLEAERRAGGEASAGSE